MATIQINDKLLSAAKAYSEAFIPSPEEQKELEELAKESEPSLLSHMGWFLYQLAETVIHAETKI